MYYYEYIKKIYKTSTGENNDENVFLYMRKVLEIIRDFEYPDKDLNYVINKLEMPLKISALVNIPEHAHLPDNLEYFLPSIDSQKEEIVDFIKCIFKKYQEIKKSIMSDR